VPAPVKLKVVPLWLIPFRNSKGEVLPEENEQPASTVTASINKFDPVLLLSVIAPDPDTVVVDPAVKVETFKFNDPVMVKAPETLTEFELVRAMALVILTVLSVIAEAPARF